MKLIAPVPPRMASLAVDHRGYPVPYFVKIINGEPDFRVLDLDRLYRCANLDLCQICGTKHDKIVWFVAGPTFVMNQSSAEPPMHRECAEYALKTCPFMLYPKAERAKKALPEDAGFNYSLGNVVLKKPPVFAMCGTEHYSTSCNEERGLYFQAGDFVEVDWWAAGLKVGRGQALEGLLLSTQQIKDRVFQGGDSDLLTQLLEEAKRWLPP